MRNMTAVMAVSAVALAALVASAYKNEQPGFRGTKWGMAVPAEWGQPVRTDPSYGGINLYRAPAEDLTLGCAKLKSVEYGFWQRRLCSVVVSFDGYSNFTCVLNAVSEKFGDGFKANQFIEQYFWPGGVTNILLQYNKVRDAGSLYLASTAIAGEQKAWEKEQARRGAHQF